MISYKSCKGGQREFLCHFKFKMCHMKNLITVVFLFNISEFLISYQFAYAVFLGFSSKITYIEEKNMSTLRKIISIKYKEATCCFSFAVLCASFLKSPFKPSRLSF